MTVLLKELYLTLINMDACSKTYYRDDHCTISLINIWIAPKKKLFCHPVYTNPKIRKKDLANPYCNSSNLPNRRTITIKRIQTNFYQCQNVERRRRGMEF